ncbi:hypothetical protein [Bacillus solimangrovi]|uniref:hypothetical protein n=1 Tax=Bacillus solimangrovi TaxID=1305675 RepID=UPI001586089C|nr:hypothetical protein [Bacillus solimangrovi]
MTAMRQICLFELQDLYELEPIKRFKAIFSEIDIDPLIYAISKKSIYGSSLLIEIR